MRRSRWMVAMVSAGLVLGCSDSTGPGSSLVVHITDPTGDAFGVGRVWDLTAFTVTRDTGGITVALDFSQPVISPVSGDSSPMIAYVVLDLDQDSTTAPLSNTVDVFRNDGGSSGLGVEVEVELVTYAADSTIPVTDSSGTIGRVKPVFNGNRVTLRLPRTLLDGDDGFLNAAAIVGNYHSPNDFAPNSGHLTLGGSTSR